MSEEVITVHMITAILLLHPRFTLRAIPRIEHEEFRRLSFLLCLSVLELLFLRLASEHFPEQLLQPHLWLGFRHLSSHLERW